MANLEIPNISSTYINPYTMDPSTTGAMPWAPDMSQVDNNAEEIRRLKDVTINQIYKTDNLEKQVFDIRETIQEMYDKLNQPGKIALQVLDKLIDFINIYKSSATFDDGTIREVIECGALSGAMDKLRRILNGDKNGTNR